MSRWTDLAAWRGPTPNQHAGHVECRGLVVHIASGYFDGTISWEKNPDANVSSHFVLARDGRLAQLVDTDDTAWTQRAGNGHWLSIECEGFAADDALHATHPGWETLTAAQIEQVAQVLIRGARQYGYPLTLAHDPTGRGLGYHSMGAEHGYDWGHLHCPGEPIKAQLPAILARAQHLAGAAPTATPSQQGDDDMGVIARDDTTGQEYHCVGGFSFPITSPEQANAIRALAVEGVIQLASRPASDPNWRDGGTTRNGWTPGVFGPVWKAPGPVPVVPVDPTAVQEGVIAALANPDVLAAIAKAVNDDDARRMQG
jgi:hypothetical protein